MEFDPANKMSGTNLHELATALCNAQGEFESIKSDRTGQTGHRTYRYADLNQILSGVRGTLSRHGLSIVQRPLESTGSIVRLETLLLHKSGQWIGSELCMTAANGTPQGIGSAITYARRYSLAAMLGLSVEEDDDGKAAGKPQGPQGTAVRVDASEPLCSEIERARIIRAAQDLEWDVAKLTEVIATINKQKLAELTKSEAASLAERLEKKFLSQQAEKTF